MTEIYTIRCFMCPEVCASVDALREHVGRVHGPRLVYELCPEEMAEAARKGAVFTASNPGIVGEVDREQRQLMGERRIYDGLRREATPPRTWPAVTRGRKREVRSVGAFGRGRGVLAMYEGRRAGGDLFSGLFQGTLQRHVAGGDLSSSLPRQVSMGGGELAKVSKVEQAEGDGPSGLRVDSGCEGARNIEGSRGLMGDGLSDCELDPPPSGASLQEGGELSVNGVRDYEPWVVDRAERFREAVLSPTPSDIWRESCMIQADVRGYQELVNYVFAHPVPTRAARLVGLVFRFGGLSPFELLFITALASEVGREMLLCVLNVWDGGKFDKVDDKVVGAVSSQTMGRYRCSSGVYERCQIDLAYGRVKGQLSLTERLVQERLLMNVREFAQALVASGPEQFQAGEGIRFSHLARFVDVREFKVACSTILVESAKSLALCVVDMGNRSPDREYATVSRTRLYRFLYKMSSGQC
jgi:hypothetical protein